MITGLGIGLVGPDDFFENIAHGHGAGSCRVEVHLGEGLDHLKQDALFDHEFHFFAEFQILQDLLDAGRVGGDELQEIGVQVVAVAHQLLQRDALGIVEGNAALPFDHFLQLIRRHSLDLGGCLQELFDGGVFPGQDAVKAADDGHGDDYAAILLRGVGPAGLVGDALYQVDLAGNVCGHGDVVHCNPSFS